MELIIEILKVQGKCMKCQMLILRWLIFCAFVIGFKMEDVKYPLPRDANVWVAKDRGGMSAEGEAGQNCISDHK